MQASPTLTLAATLKGPLDDVRVLTLDVDFDVNVMHTCLEAARRARVSLLAFGDSVLCRRTATHAVQSVIASLKMRAL